jgi:hypothetical protein
MAAKSSTTTTTLTSKQVQKSLAKTKDLSVEEEKLLRMRHGSPVDPKAPLERKAAEGSEAADELLLMEMQLLKAYREHLASQTRTKTVAKPRAAAAVARPTTGNKAKDKIVRALRKKR